MSLLPLLFLIPNIYLSISIIDYSVEMGWGSLCLCALIRSKLRRSWKKGR